MTPRRMKAAATVYLLAAFVALAAAGWLGHVDSPRRAHERPARPAPSVRSQQLDGPEPFVELRYRTPAGSCVGTSEQMAARYRWRLDPTCPQP